MSLEIGGSFAGVPLAGWVALLAVVAIKGSIMLTFALTIIRFLKRKPAGWRSRVWTVTFCALLVLPAVSGYSLFQGKPTLTEQIGTPAELAPPVRFVAPTQAPSSAAPATVASQRDSQPALLLTLWLTGALVFGLRCMRALWLGRRAAHSALPLEGPALSALLGQLCAEQGIQSKVELACRTDADVPFVWSVHRTIIVLPAQLAAWEPSALRPLLVHELAHVKRFDLLRLILIEVTKALHWFNPLIHVAAKRAQLAIEMDCDRVACKSGDPGQTKRYSQLLVWFARDRATRPPCAPAMARANEVEDRIQNLLQPRVSTERRWLSGIALPILGAVLLMPLVSTYSIAGETGGHLDMARPLSQAIEAGDVTKALRLLDESPTHLEALNSRGLTPIALAAWHGQGDLVDALAELGAALDQRNDNGLTALFCAMDRSRWGMARRLLKHGADPFTRGFRGRSLLHEAARNNSLELARNLLAAGVPINRSDADGSTPLDHALWFDRVEMAQMLRGEGAVSSGIARPAWAQRVTHKAGHTRAP